MRDIAYLALVVALLASTQALGEVNPFDGETVIQSGSGGNDATVNAAGGRSEVGSMLSDPGQIRDTSAENAVQGRRDKTDDAIQKGKQGVGAAIAAGTALTARGVSLLPWPTTPRGVALITLGAIEFAQAAATAGVTSQNRSGRDILINGTPEGSQSNVRDLIRSQLDTPELRQALGERGVNSDNFIEEVANGNLRSFDDVKAALGVTEDISPEQAAQAQVEAQGFFAGAMPTATHSDDNGREDVARVALDDGAPRPGENGSGSSALGQGFGGGGLVTSGDGRGAASEEGLSNAELAKADPALVAQAQAMAARAMELAKRTNTAGMPGLDMKSLTDRYLAALMGKKQGGKLTAAQALAYMNLDRLGIKKLRQRQNIFHIARKSYRDFERWRTKSKKRMTQLAAAR